MFDLSVIIVSFNTKKLLEDCVNSIVKNTKKIKYEIVVIDNNSIDGSLDYLKRLSKSKENIKLILNDKNVGFGKANNQGLKVSIGRYILLLNTDTLVSSNVLGEMVDWMDDHKEIGISSCALKNKDGSTQGTGGYFPTLIRVFSWMIIQDIPFVDYFIKPFHPVHNLSFSKGENFYKKERELDWVTGAFLLMRKRVYEDIGGFDENYFMYTEETDLCYRARKQGWRIYYLPFLSIIHYGGASGKLWSHVVSEYQGVKRFYKKHYPSWQYPILRVLLKVGALGRMVLFGILRGKEAFLTYAHAFKIA